jgi:RNA polymerase sigma-70 factor (ECF subfamily)
VASDQQIWERLCRGDARAFDAFYQEQASRLLGFLRHYLGDAQAAQDITQETFLAFWQKPNGFDPRRGTLRGYLFGIARHRAAEWRRRRPRTEAPAHERTAADGERAMLLADAIGQMGPDERGLLWLREVEGHSYAELAAILDLPLGTVKSRLFSAREMLRRIWMNCPAS